MRQPILTTAAIFAVFLSAVSRQQGAEGPSSGRFLEHSRIPGGLCVIVGAPDTALAERIVREGSFLVHILCPTAAQADAARQSLLEELLYGRVSAESWMQPGLPYVDTLVSLLVAPNGQLLVYDTETGQQVNEMKLPQAAWDGLAAAHGCLYVSTADGQVVCLAPPRDSAKP